MTRAMIFTAVCLAVAAGLMALQVYLSKRDGKWPGLIIPIIFFLISLLYPLNMSVPSEGVNGSFIVSLLFSWITGNIPTFITLGIYFTAKKDKKQS